MLRIKWREQGLKQETSKAPEIIQVRDGDLKNITSDFDKSIFGGIMGQKPHRSWFQR